MKTNQLIVVLLSSIIFASSQAQVHAGFYSGNELVALMREYDRADTNAKEVDWVKAGEYMAYISGVVDANGFLYNIPEGATKGQIVAVVSKYLKNHPEAWTEPAASLVRKALSEAFPLKKSK